ncbi:Non-catalytic module family DOC2 [Piromyces sp. E2]|nr:Non-catalytic module family DOC2 [Piromyces sp. E2]|eukprot:OUM59397.1 Non-catalytic module family DOC2 [Piromyces sp. E2]
MKNYSLFLLGLVLLNIPKNNGKKCAVGQDYYPCCQESEVIYTDQYGDWGIENGEWCIFPSVDSCFSLAYGYPCCEGNQILFTDNTGYWGVENGDWCGIEKDSTNSCFSIPFGYSCCKSCDVVVTDSDGQWVIPGNPEFDFTFLKLENNKKNMLYSPLSIKYALQMLLEGAVGTEQLTKYKNIDQKLSLANSVFIRDKIYSYVKSTFINTLKQKYDSEVVKDSFTSAAIANKWIEEKTFGIIKNMLSDEIFEDPETAMLLINALAIQIEWDSAFSCDDTSGRTFYISDGRTMTATTMSKKICSSSVSYFIGADVTAVTMDLKQYGDKQLEFMAIMPNKIDLDSFVKNVTKEQIDIIDQRLNLSSLTENGVRVRIPKFKFSYDLPLKSDLKAMGVNTIFNEYMADLSKIADPSQLRKRLYVSDALHKADIEITEKGVKAAAVTAVIIKTTKGLVSNPTYPIEVNIDRSFMFIIRDKNTKDVWFTGTSI